MKFSRFFRPLTAACFAFCLLAAPCAASLITIQNGSTPIGTLNSSIGATGNESATFTLLPEFRGLMSDSLGLQFRYFQAIYYDDEPVTYLNQTITAASAPAHTGTVIDTPAGGWDYQLPRGDDRSPFYESDTAKNPTTNQPYSFPTLSYPYLHSADGTNPGTSSTLDSPGLASAGHQTLFETYLVFLDPFMAASHTFNLLGGYSWGVGRNTTQLYGIDGGGISFSDITTSKVTELQFALNRSGFVGADAWTVEAFSSFGPTGGGGGEIPEPATAMLYAFGLIVIVLRRRRSRKA